MLRGRMQEVARRFTTNEMATIEVFGRMETMKGTMKNLSTSGCFLELTKGDYVPQEGDCLRIILPLKSLNKTRNLFGQVVWKKGVGFGITFIKKDDISKNFIYISILLTV
ncbi:MAG: hypothetical protein B7Y39_14420 [Bdellovibrio sp. 28-41-41]|nr:MAG: hypothetical protein B7Y39_14420 [Bdellovibrio sp. 28-41-41]